MLFSVTPQQDQQESRRSVCIPVCPFSFPLMRLPMKYKIEQVTVEDEFKICPVCGYADGFHSMLKNEQDRLLWLFICPSCHGVFDIGYTVKI